MNKAFEKWWYGTGSEEWAENIENGTVKAIESVWEAAPQWQDMRVRDIGELIEDSDIVLYGKKFTRLGFHNEYGHYYAGRCVTPMMMPIITSSPLPEPPKQ